MPVHDWTKVEDGIFHDFHLEWISCLKQELNNGVLPDSFYALAEQDAGPGIPDVLTLQRQDHANGSNGAGGTALSVVAPKVRFRDRAERKRKLQPRQRRIAIRHVSGDGIVAFIEIVSPGNKSSRRAIRKFVQKSTAFIEQEIHLLVLDLFPPGGLDPARIPPPPHLARRSTAPISPSPAGQAADTCGVQCRDSRGALRRTGRRRGPAPKMPLFLPKTTT
ncbi:MAG: DUF4058 family protein [Gemmataceae bacterium]